MKFSFLPPDLAISRSATHVLMSCLVLLFSFVAHADTTNTLSDSEIQGRALAQKILAQSPQTNSTVTGILNIRNATGNHTNYPVKLRISVRATDWITKYTVDTHGPMTENFQINHPMNGLESTYSYSLSSFTSDVLLPYEEALPFAGSDFWLGDLGLGFFHWPQQKVVKKEFHRQCACTVLESTNPTPSTNTYSRVVCWIDNDSLGIVEANAYDANGKKLKNFYPKNLEKVNGQYQVESMVMENVQSGSKSVLEFDWGK